MIAATINQQSIPKRVRIKQHIAVMAAETLMRAKTCPFPKHIPNVSMAIQMQRIAMFIAVTRGCLHSSLK